MNKEHFSLKQIVCITLAALSLALSSPASFAGDGHDHGDAPAAASGNGPKRQLSSAKAISARIRFWSTPARTASRALRASITTVISG